MVLVGGMGSILGTIFGAVFMTVLPEGIRLLRDILSNDFPFLITRLADLQASFYGLVIILFLIFEPGALRTLGPTEKLLEGLAVHVLKKRRGEQREDGIRLLDRIISIRGGEMIPETMS